MDKGKHVPELDAFLDLALPNTAVETDAPNTVLRGNQAETNRFLGTIAGTVSIPEFFAPENMQRIIEGRTAWESRQVTPG